MSECIYLFVGSIRIEFCLLIFLDKYSYPLYIKNGNN